MFFSATMLSNILHNDLEYMQINLITTKKLFSLSRSIFWVDGLFTHVHRVYSALYALTHPRNRLDARWRYTGLESG